MKLLACLGLIASLAGPAQGAIRHADFAGAKPSPDARRVADWVVNSHDNQGKPFMIIDKRRAHLYVFEPDGRGLGHAPVLLGSARGDDTAPGIGERKLADVKPWEKTTPAGRFVAERGFNLRNEDVLWVDYDSAVSMHRVLTTNPKERRLQRLATPTPADNRISYGCINVPTRFFDTVVENTIVRGPTIVYVLPEVKKPQAVFAGLSSLRADTTAPVAARATGGAVSRPHPQATGMR